MKKLVALILALGLVIACIPALALETDDVFGGYTDVNRGHWAPPWDHSEWKEMIRFELKHDATISADVYDSEGNLFNSLIVDQDYSAGNVIVNWPAVNADGWHPGNGVMADYDVVVTAVIDGETYSITYPYSIIFSHDISDHYSQDIMWYSHNNICVGGLEFRQEKPEVTNKWYNFAPIDLSVQGEQVFELVASNLYVIGSVVVTVDGDDVTVEWKLNKQGTTDANFQDESEFLTFFHNIDEVTSVEPKDIETSFEFGQPISIANDLGGDTNVLLYIRNVATYCNNLSYKYQNPIFHPNFDRNVPFRVAYQEEMRELMKMELQ